MTWLLLSTTSLLLLADGEPPADAAPGNPLPQLLIMGLLFFGVFYFFVMRPQQKRDAQHRSLLESLKKNDRVMTIGGMIGTVANVNRDKGIVTLKLNETTSAQFTVGAISRVLGDEDDKKEDNDEK